MTTLSLRAERIRLSRNGPPAFVRWNPRHEEFECRFECGQPWQLLHSWDSAAEIVLQGLSQNPYVEPV